jgi:HlyD family secretion protein
MRSRARGMAIVFAMAALAACRGAAEREKGAAEAVGTPAGGAARGAPAPAAAIVHVALDADAQRLAGVQTEVVEAKPFARTLVLPARISPVAETEDEIEARLAFRSAVTRERRATQELERERKLAAGNVVAAKALQAAEAEAAQATLERTRAETALRKLGLDPGHETASPVADVWALADLFGPQAPLVTPGSAAVITAESRPGESFRAKVSSLAHFLDPRTRTLTARLAVDDPGHRLRAQETVVATITLDEHPALSVPDEAVLYEGTDRVLFVAKDGGFDKRTVQVGARQGGRTEITAGLAAGDAVVTRGAQFLLGELSKVREPGKLEED